MSATLIFTERSEVQRASHSPPSHLQPPLLANVDSSPGPTAWACVLTLRLAICLRFPPWRPFCHQLQTAERSQTRRGRPTAGGPGFWAPVDWGWGWGGGHMAAGPEVERDAHSAEIMRTWPSSWGPAGEAQGRLPRARTPGMRFTGRVSWEPTWAAESLAKDQPRLAGGPSGFLCGACWEPPQPPTVCACAPERSQQTGRGERGQETGEKGEGLVAHGRGGPRMVF